MKQVTSDSLRNASGFFRCATDSYELHNAVYEDVEKVNSNGKVISKISGPKTGGKGDYPTGNLIPMDQKYAYKGTYRKGF